MTSNQRREQVYRTEALVIGRMDLGEADRIFTLFTLEHGKLRAIAKGVRRPKSRLGPHLELLSRTRLMLAKRRDLDIVTGAENIDQHWSLRTDLLAFGNACYLAELLNQLTEDRQELRDAYELLGSSIDLLSRGVDPFVVSRHFEWMLMTLLGFRPNLYQCASCERDIEADVNGLSARLGGMLCPACLMHDLNAPKLSINAQKYIRLLDRNGLSAALSLQVDEMTIAEIERALSGYVRHHAEREARSLTVLRALHSINSEDQPPDPP